MRDIKRIIIHCSATPENVDISVKQIRMWHVRDRGWSDVGYHFIIKRDGMIETGRPIMRPGAHTRGMNMDSVGICYIGGLDRDHNPKDTRTPEQKESLKKLVLKLKKEYQIEEVKGHRDYSPDLNNDGVITPEEWMKSCPCFDVQKEL